ncbi:hypothetical protein N7492_001692 [Penicillium capsulatum]|uniref:Uncharacterized protein n=1 Tax=Penicillium capsulatum TaxID=69766 RepID=A0A9W9LZN4_9EURO|nr:hypothetical protein N7492_001692 [Penicillium capsulatum]KAJ6129256.1 hypothetical protein N7512_002036 [Penicillium capsulatum]
MPEQVRAGWAIRRPGECPDGEVGHPTWDTDYTIDNDVNFCYYLRDLDDFFYSIQTKLEILLHK